jgi:hypothetical protein
VLIQVESATTTTTLAAAITTTTTPTATTTTTTTTPRRHHQLGFLTKHGAEFSALANGRCEFEGNIMIFG